jgi:hypothetical protein
MLRQGGVEKLCECDGLFNPIDHAYSIAESSAYTASDGYCHFPRPNDRCECEDFEIQEHIKLDASPMRA